MFSISKILIIECPLIIINVLVGYMHLCRAKVLQLDETNFDQTIGPAQVAVVNFYADWCRFSEMLKPVFEETSQNFENQTNVVFGKVDCDSKVELARRFNINKFPTLKYFRYGQLSKREYRGSRSVEALSQFVRENTEPVFVTVTSQEDLEAKIEANKRNIIIYLSTLDNNPEMYSFLKIGSNLREDCKFYLAAGTIFQDQLTSGNKVVFRPPQDTGLGEISLSGDMLRDFEYLKQWITDKCIPMVRELTFSNAEELTEEGLPLLVLFRRPDDHKILETFTEQVAVQLHDQKTFINVLHADGLKFAHPLHHLGKSVHDLPIIAIDSFTHMYLFPDVKKMTESNSLKQFVADLYSGKLHREFHNGPDPTTIPGIDQSPEQQRETNPPSSVFQKLKPSPSRYTLLRDEL